MARGALRFVVLAVPLLLVAGCPQQKQDFVAPELSANLKFVMNHPATFKSNVTNGELIVRDGELDGCWGRAALNVSGTDGTIDLFQVIHFSAAAGTVEKQAVGRATDTGVEGLTISTGTFEVLSDGQVRVTFTDFQNNDPATGAIKPVTDATDQTSTAVVLRSGNVLLIAEGNDPTAAFVKLACR